MIEINIIVLIGICAASVVLTLVVVRSFRKKPNKLTYNDLFSFDDKEVDKAIESLKELDRLFTKFKEDVDKWGIKDS